MGNIGRTEDRLADTDVAEIREKERERGREGETRAVDGSIAACRGCPRSWKVHVKSSRSLVERSSTLKCLGIAIPGSLSILVYPGTTSVSAMSESRIKIYETGTRAKRAS
jgi:hypothetical protein